MSDNSTPQHPLISKDNYQEQDAHAWEVDYKQKLEEVLRADDRTLEKVVDIVFKFGILERIAPKDLARMKARKEERRKIWLQGQNDPKLYWSIMYSAAHLIHNSKKGQLVNAGPVGIAYKTLLVMLTSTGLLTQLAPQGENLGVLVGKKLQELAKIELEKRDKKQSHEMIHIGASGEHKKKKSTVVGYHPEGKIILEVYATSADMLGLNEGLNITVYPWELDPEEFKTRTMPQYQKREEENEKEEKDN